MVYGVVLSTQRTPPYAPGLVSRVLQQLQDHRVIADGGELRQRRGHGVRAAGLGYSMDLWIFQDDIDEIVFPL